jgi:hypothetical protein
MESYRPLGLVLARHLSHSTKTKCCHGSLFLATAKSNGTKDLSIKDCAKFALKAVKSLKTAAANSLIMASEGFYANDLLETILPACNLRRFESIMFLYRY